MMELLKLFSLSQIECFYFVLVVHFNNNNNNNKRIVMCG